MIKELSKRRRSARTARLLTITIVKGRVSPDAENKDVVKVTWKGRCQIRAEDDHKSQCQDHEDEAQEGDQIRTINSKDELKEGEYEYAIHMGKSRVTAFQYGLKM